jgi:hypothetical protein
MIIGIGHIAQVGKDTVANYMVEKYGFKKLSFADPLKQACAAIFHLNKEQLYGNLKEVIDPFWNATPRYILQKVGTDCLRNVYDKDVWVRSTECLINQNPTVDFVIPDCRFLNEVSAIKRWGGRLLRVTRSVCGAKGGIAGHASETALLGFEGWDYTVHNDGSFEDLYRKVDNLIKLIK